MTQIEAAEAIAQLPQPDNREYLTLQDIATACNVSYKVARQYADVDGVKAWMGAYTHAASKGVRYPLESEARWRMLFDAAGKKLLTPATIQAWLANVQISAPAEPNAPLPSSGNLMPVQAIAQLPQMGEEVIVLLRQLVNCAASTPEQIAALHCMAAALDRHSALLERLPAPEDALLSLTDAHRVYGVPMSVLRDMRVSCGKRGRVKRSVILRYIAAL